MSKKRQTIFVFGNQRVKKDSLPLRILPKLRKRFPKIEFVVEDPTEVLTTDSNEWWILDAAEGISEVTIIDDLSWLENAKRVSVHDYDVAMDLKLLQKLGKLDKVRILAVPIGMEEEEVLRKVTSLLVQAE